MMSDHTPVWVSYYFFLTDNIIEGSLADNTAEESLAGEANAGEALADDSAKS